MKIVLWLFVAWFSVTGVFAGGVYVRFKMEAPTNTIYSVKLGGFIHKSPWYLPTAVWPQGADREKQRWVASGSYTPWCNLGELAGDKLHGRMSRAGGVAEFPNVTADFITMADHANRTVVIELATKPDTEFLVKTIKESYTGSLTSFLVSPDLRKDVDDLETASEMTARRLSWAKAATGGNRISPEKHIIQTSFWSPQRPELNLLEAETLWLLGFNLVGNQQPEVLEAFDFAAPGHTHGLTVSPSAAREDIVDRVTLDLERKKLTLAKGVPLGFSDEICARPPIGNDRKGIELFQAWLKKRKIKAKELGVKSLDDVMPIETPPDLEKRMEENEAAARRIFYYTSRFRQEAGTERLKWHSEAAHEVLGDGPVTTSMVADHPYFGGTGLGMGMVQNSSWGGYPLALDWFDLARRRAVDMIGIEDWMGLQYMYGPNYTWEGFQLMGFQANIMRSGSQGTLPIIAWITPSDHTNLVLKSTSALCQGAKHFFYWTYGPTATSTENYWSDIDSAYTGIATMTRMLAESEPFLADGKHRKTRVAMLYSISSDLWQPFDYIHMLERRCVYLSLVHGQYMVDFLTEEDVEAGRLKDYDALYVTDPCITEDAMKKIRLWVKKGGTISGSCAAGSLNEFGEPVDGLADIFGVKPGYETQVQRKGRYQLRGGLNRIAPFATIATRKETFDVIGTRDYLDLDQGTVTGTFVDGSPAVVENQYGRGHTRFVASCPGISYARDAKFVPTRLAEKWPAIQRGFILEPLVKAKVAPLVELSHPVVEAGVYDHPSATVLVLANFTYEPIRDLECRVPMKKRCFSIRSLQMGSLDFVNEDAHAVFKVPLGLNDIILLQ